MALSDPTRQLGVVQQIIEMVKPKTTGADPNNAVMMMMFNMVQKQNDELREEMRDMRKQRQEPPAKDVQTVLLETIAIAEQLGFRRGGSSVKTDPWASFLEKVVDNAPLLAEILVNGPQGAQQAAQVAHIAPPQQQQPTARQTTDESEEEQPQMTQQEKDTAAKMAAFEPIIRNSIGPMIEAVKANAPAALKRWFLDEYGRTNFEALKQEIGPERMAHLATTHPLLRPQLPDKTHMLRFFNEVFA